MKVKDWSHSVKDKTAQASHPPRDIILMDNSIPEPDKELWKQACTHLSFLLFSLHQKKRDFCKLLQRSAGTWSRMTQTHKYVSLSTEQLLYPVWRVSLLDFIYCFWSWFLYQVWTLSIASTYILKTIDDSVWYTQVAVWKINSCSSEWQHLFKPWLNWLMEEAILCIC